MFWSKLGLESLFEAEFQVPDQSPGLIWAWVSGHVRVRIESRVPCQSQVSSPGLGLNLEFQVKVRARSSLRSEVGSRVRDRYWVKIGFESCVESRSGLGFYVGVGSSEGQDSESVPKARVSMDCGGGPE
ncbi:hypothetical protein HAX54_026404 [Datura stramonium]|uniref:Uncharacterized protein n=1 Tax=Datura stramonium TaxID=4076 RepID=A0ABS8S7C6_DATST|nr:hypothetical protein [Datura stramonium]